MSRLWKSTNRLAHCAALLLAACGTVASGRGGPQTREIILVLQHADAETVYHAITLTRWPDSVPPIETVLGSQLAEFGPRRIRFAPTKLAPANAAPAENRIHSWAQGSTVVAMGKAPNTLVLTGEGDVIADLARRARRIDVSPRPVKIKVEVVSTPRGILNSIGYSLIWQRAAGDGAAPSFLGIGIGNVAARVFGGNSGGVRVINAPILETRENSPVAWFSSFATQTLIRSWTGGREVLSKEAITLPVGLVVVPRLYADGTISLGVGVQALALGPTLTKAGTPALTSRQINFQVRLAQHETLLIGGAVGDREDHPEARALSDLPSRAGFLDRNEPDVFILVTPEID